MRALAALLVLAVAVAGCTGQPTQPVTPPGDGGNGGDGGNRTGNNTSRVSLPPVARIQMFDADNALVFESNFVADDATPGSAVRGGADIRFVGSNSEAVDKTATIEAWNWEFSGPGLPLTRQSGRSVTQAFPDLGGIFRARLTVTDSHRLSDQLNLTVGVYATRTFTEPVNGTGALQAGTLGLNQPAVDTAELPLELKASVQGFPVEVEGLVLNVTPGEASSDFDLYLLDAEGTVLASSAASPAPGEMEEVSLGPGALTPGTYTIRVVFFAGVQGTFTLAGEATYRVVNAQVEEQFGGHAH